MTRSRWRAASWLLLSVGVVGILYVATMVLPGVLVPDADITGEEDQDAQALIALQTERIQAQNSARAGTLQAIAGAALAFGAFATWRTVKVNQEGQVTDRYTRAIDQLGNADTSISTGGIYALERISHDSERDRATIVEVLVAFVRRHANPVEEPATPRLTYGPPLASRAPHLQAAVTVLGRIAQAKEIRLGNVGLQSADLAGANLTGADLTGANLTGADLAGADLTGADLTDAVLTGVMFTNAGFTHATLTGANLTNSNLTCANLAHANLINSNLTRADLTEANLAHARLIRANLADADLTSADLTDVWLHGAKLTGADLDGADLTDANLTDVWLSGARLPEGFRPADHGGRRA